jgi:hypothetical protein
MLNVMRCLMDTANVVPSCQKGGLGFESPIRPGDEEQPGLDEARVAPRVLR